MNNGHPFALTVNQNLDGANNMTFLKTICEIPGDDALDANGDPNILSFITPECHGLLFYNQGENLNDLSCLRGLSSVIKGKSPSKIGMMNKGYIAGECFLHPSKVYNLSRDSSGKLIYLVYESGEHYKMIKQSRQNFADMALAPDRFMRSGVVDIYLTKELNDMFCHIKHTSFKSMFQQILNIESKDNIPHFLLTIMLFDQTHDLYGYESMGKKKLTLLDSKLNACIPDFNLLYGNILKKGLVENNRVPKITFVSSDGSETILNDTTAQDIHDGHPCIHAETTVYSDNAEKNPVILFEIVLSMDGFPNQEQFWISNQPEDGRCKKFGGTQVFYKKPLCVDRLVNRGKFVAHFSILSEKEDEEQLKKIGGSFSKTESLRGLFLSWNRRILGSAYWNKQWGEARNSGKIRASIEVQNNHYIIQKAFNIQTDKSSMNLDESSPITHRFLEHFVGNLIKQVFQSTKKTEAQKKNSNYKFQEKWNPTTLFPVILYGSPRNQPRATPPVPVPVPAPAPAPVIVPAPVVVPAAAAPVVVRRRRILIGPTVATEPVPTAAVASEETIATQETATPPSPPVIAPSFTAPVNPIEVPAPKHKFQFMKDTVDKQYIGIFEDGVQITKVKCFGQPHLMIDEYQAVLLLVGEARFREIIVEEAMRRETWAHP